MINPGVDLEIWNRQDCGWVVQEVEHRCISPVGIEVVGCAGGRRSRANQSVHGAARRGDRALMIPCVGKFILEVPHLHI